MYKIETISEAYPGLACVTSERKKSHKDPHFFLVRSPFGNCQSFCINNVCGALILPDGDFKKILKDIYKDFGKRIVVIDVKSIDSNRIIERFEDTIKEITSTQYISSNGSHMIMHIITLNMEVLLRQ